MNPYGNLSEENRRADNAYPRHYFPQIGLS